MARKKPKYSREELEDMYGDSATAQSHPSRDPGRHEGGYHSRSDRGDYVTVNNTEDPKWQDKDPDSYYVTSGNPEDGHVTQIFDSEGNQIGESDSKK